jgi:hypothetical protein
VEFLVELQRMVPDATTESETLGRERAEASPARVRTIRPAPGDDRARESRRIPAPRASGEPVA